jgi:hypothetical protein
MRQLAGDIQVSKGLPAALQGVRGYTLAKLSNLAFRRLEESLNKSPPELLFHVCD